MCWQQDGATNYWYWNTKSIIIWHESMLQHRRRHHHHHHNKTATTTTTTTNKKKRPSYRRGGRRNGNGQEGAGQQSGSNIQLHVDVLLMGCTGENGSWWPCFFFMVNKSHTKTLSRVDCLDRALDAFGFSAFYNAPLTSPLPLPHSIPEVSQRDRGLIVEWHFFLRWGDTFFWSQDRPWRRR